MTNNVIECISESELEEAKNVTIELQDKSSDPKWFQIKKDNSTYLFFSSISKSSVEDEAALYEKMYKEEKKNIDGIAMYLKKATIIQPIPNHPKIELLIKTQGVPLYYYKKMLILSNSSIDWKIFPYIISQAVESIAKMNAIHGEINQMNILYSHSARSLEFKIGASFEKIDFLIKNRNGIFSTKHIDSFNKAYISTQSKWNVEEALFNDIASIILSIFDVGFIKNDKNEVNCISDKEFEGNSKYGIDIEKLFASKNNIISTTSGVIKIQNFANFLKETLTNGKISYEIFMKTINLFYENGAFQTYKNVNVDNKQPFETKINKEIVKSYRIKSLINRTEEIFLIEPVNYPKFIIKKYKEQHNYDTEKSIFKTIEEISSKNPLNSLIKALPSTINYIKPADKELAIEFGSSDLESMIKSVAKEELLRIIPKIVGSIAHDLVAANLYHADIKPANITFNISKQEAYLIDYDTSYIFKENVQSRFSFLSKGFTSEFSPPEILYGHLVNNCIVLGIPFYIDMYCLGKTLISLLYGLVESDEIAKKMYYQFIAPDASFQGYKNINNLHPNKINVKDWSLSLDALEKTKFYYQYRKNLKNFTNSLKSSDFQEDQTFTKTVLNFLARMVEENEGDRPNYAEIIEFSKIVPQLPQTRPKKVAEGKKGWKIKYLQEINANIIPISSLESFFIPDMIGSKLCFHEVKLDKVSNEYQIKYISKDNCPIPPQSKTNCPLSNCTLFDSSEIVYLLDSVNKKLQFYSIGGFSSSTSNQICKDVYQLTVNNPTADTFTLTFSATTQMKCARYAFGVASYGACFSVAGGLGDEVENATLDRAITNPLNVLETYNREQNQWKKEMLNFSRVSPALFYTDNDTVYVVGGSMFVASSNQSDKKVAVPCLEIESINISTGDIAVIKLMTKLESTISNCSLLSFPTDINTVLILKDVLDYEDNNSYDVSCCLLKIEQDGAKVEPSSNKFECFTNYSSQAIIRFSNDDLIIPSVIKSCGAASVSFLLFNHSTKSITKVKQQ